MHTEAMETEAMETEAMETEAMETEAMETEAMETALRILTAVLRHQHPDQADIETLERYADPTTDAGLDLDELACAVADRVLKNRSGDGL